MATKKNAKKKEVKKNQGIGEYARKLIKTTDMTNAEIAADCQKKFGGNTSPASVAWYRSKMYASGEIKKTTKKSDKKAAKKKVAKKKAAKKATAPKQTEETAAE